MMNKAKKLDRNIRLAMSSSKHKNTNKAFKMGGTITASRGNWSGRVTKCGKDELGRWSYLDMTGKNEKKVRIITMYRVCRSKQGSGNCTIRIQQETDIIQQKGKYEDPRELVLKDLEKYIN